MSESEIPPKGSLEYIKYKRRLYNKKYQEKIKHKIESVAESENNEEEELLEEPPQQQFFFQPKPKKTLKVPQQVEQPQIVLKMPETSITTHLKNQLIMGSLTLIPMLCSALYKLYEKKQNNSSVNQSMSQSSQPLEMQNQLNFL